MNTRQQILEATQRIIQMRGLARVTTKEIAREAGCAEGTLYKHFESKEDLFLAVIQENLPYLLETLYGQQPGTGTIQENLVEIAHAALDYYDKLIPLATAFFADSELLASYRKLLTSMNSGPLRLYERVAEYIQAEQQLGHIDPQLEPISVSALLLGSCFQYVFFRHFLGTCLLNISDQQYVADLIQTLTHGLVRQE